MNEILTVIQVAIMFLIGLIFIFEGYRIERVIITIIWFLLGFNIAKDILGIFEYSTGIVPFIIEVIVGACFAAVGYKLEGIAIFVAVTYGAFYLIPSYFVLNNKIVYLVIRLLIALLIGLLAVRFRIIVYILIASMFGATLMKRAILLLFPAISGEIMAAVNIGVIILIVIGLFSQLAEYHETSY